MTSLKTEERKSPTCVNNNKSYSHWCSIVRIVCTGNWYLDILTAEKLNDYMRKTCRHTKNQSWKTNLVSKSTQFRCCHLFLTSHPYHVELWLLKVYAKCTQVCSVIIVLSNIQGILNITGILLLLLKLQCNPWYWCSKLATVKKRDFIFRLWHIEIFSSDK